jgi:hypothetical protein
VSEYLKRVWDDAVAADKARNIYDGIAQGDHEKDMKLEAD